MSMTRWRITKMIKHDTNLEPTVHEGRVTLHTNTCYGLLRGCTAAETGRLVQNEHRTLVFLPHEHLTFTWLYTKQMPHYCICCASFKTILWKNAPHRPNGRRLFEVARERVAHIRKTGTISLTISQRCARLSTSKLVQCIHQPTHGQCCRRTVNVLDQQQGRCRFRHRPPCQQQNKSKMWESEYVFYVHTCTGCDFDSGTITGQPGKKRLEGEGPFCSRYNGRIGKRHLARYVPWTES